MFPVLNIVNTHVRHIPLQLNRTAVFSLPCKQIIILPYMGISSDTLCKNSIPYSGKFLRKKIFTNW